MIQGAGGSPGWGCLADVVPSLSVPTLADSDLGQGDCLAERQLCPVPAQQETVRHGSLRLHVSWSMGTKCGRVILIVAMGQVFESPLQKSVWCVLFRGVQLGSNSPLGDKVPKGASGLLKGTGSPRVINA